jgi:hypothetical protein
VHSGSVRILLLLLTVQRLPLTMITSVAQREEYANKLGYASWGHYIVDCDREMLERDCSDFDELAAAQHPADANASAVLASHDTALGVSACDEDQPACEADANPVIVSVSDTASADVSAEIFDDGHYAACTAYCSTSCDELGDDSRGDDQGINVDTTSRDSFDESPYLFRPAPAIPTTLRLLDHHTTPDVNEEPKNVSAASDETPCRFLDGHDTFDNDSNWDSASLDESSSSRTCADVSPVCRQLCGDIPEASKRDSAAPDESPTFPAQSDAYHHLRPRYDNEEPCAIASHFEVQVCEPPAAARLEPVDPSPATCGEYVPFPAASGDSTLSFPIPGAWPVGPHDEPEIPPTQLSRSSLLAISATALAVGAIAWFLL